MTKARIYKQMLAERRKPVLYLEGVVYPPPPGVKRPGGDTFYLFVESFYSYGASFYISPESFHLGGESFYISAESFYLGKASFNISVEYFNFYRESFNISVGSFYPGLKENNLAQEDIYLNLEDLRWVNQSGIFANKFLIFVNKDTTQEAEVEIALV